MKIIIAGSREVTEYLVVDAAMYSALALWNNPEISLVIQGGARGTDSLGREWAHRHRIACRTFAAEWDIYGRSAGYRRNADMADVCQPGEDGLVAVWDGVSRGTLHMINLAKERGLRVYVHRIEVPQ